MCQIVSKIAPMPAFHARAAATGGQIAAAEERLGLRFSDEYRDYLSAFGAASWYGHELTGICGADRLNVVNVTLSLRPEHPGIPAHWYVVEESGVDGIAIWQTPDGAIFQSAPGRPSLRLCGSLCEYMDL